MNKHMRNPTFTTKEEYIQYRKDWKEDYMVLSQIIRDHKLIRRYCGQAQGKAVQMIDGDPFTYDNISKYFRYIDQNKKENEHLQSLLQKYNTKKALYQYRIEAAEMMNELEQSKLNSKEQYIASKQLINI